MIQNINFICRRIMNYHKHTGQVKRPKYNDYKLIVTNTIDRLGYDKTIDHFKKVYPGIQFNQGSEVFDIQDDNSPDTQLEMF